MIQVTNTTLFADALDCLKRHKGMVGGTFKGRFVQIFLAMKFFQNSIPSMYSGAFITTEVLQSLLDDLFAKASWPANNCVLSLFEGDHLARTGLIGPGNTTPQNTWRNNLNLQKGIGCYAPVADLSSLTFLNQDRSLCRHLQATTPGNLAGGRCGLCLSGASYRNESHRKWLRIDPGGSGYSATDTQNTANFAPYVAPGGARIPLAPLIVALYHDADPGLVLGTRTAVSGTDFAADFNFSQQEIATYFETSITDPLNAALAASAGWAPGSSLGPLFGAAFGTTGPGGAAAPAPTPPLPAGPVQPVLGGTPAPPPLVNNGWDAEQYVAAALTSAGWTSHVVSRQQLGFDIFAQRGTQRRYVEVKSSLGLCSPSLTAREWQQASYHGSRYLLTILENFSPTGTNTIHWVPDPAVRCISTTQTTVSHGIPRSSWASATVPIGNI